MEKITLSNGFRIMLEEIPHAKSATMGVWVGSGSRFETLEDAGVSHFIEHMLFKGTERRTAVQIAEEIDGMGAMLNAYTAKEYTCYYARSLTEHVSEVFEILCDMLCHPKMEEESFLLEKQVILEEIKMYEDSPEDLSMDSLYQEIWKGNMLGANILGTAQTMEQMERNQLCRHMERYYVPERMVVSVCGNFDKAALIAQCETYFGERSPGQNPISCEMAKYSRSAVFVKRDFEQLQIDFGFPGISIDDSRRYVLHSLQNIFGASSSSRLYQTLREELGLVYSVDSFSSLYLKEGLVGISLALSPECQEQAMEAVFQVIAGMREDISQQELSRAKEQSKASLIMGLESTAARASNMGRGELFFSHVSTEEEVLEQINQVMREDVLELARELLNPEHVSVSAVGRSFQKDCYDAIVTEVDVVL